MKPPPSCCISRPGLPIATFEIASALVVTSGATVQFMTPSTSLARRCTSTEVTARCIGCTCDGTLAAKSCETWRRAAIRCARRPFGRMSRPLRQDCVWRSLGLAARAALFDAIVAARASVSRFPWC
ncbi:MAG: hypothetical protein JO090_14265 [Rhizobacter sp.]|nr:hypothetical protein [Rhizobacter sp.]